MSDEESKSAERTQAERDSRGCQFCGGGGFATVFHPDYDGNSILKFVDAERGEFAAAGRAASHCICAIGRWMRSKTSQNTLGRIPDFAIVLNGRSFWLPRDPRFVDGEYVHVKPGSFRERLKRVTTIPDDIRRAANHARSETPC